MGRHRSGSGQVFQQDAAHLPQCGRALLRAVKAREDGLHAAPSRRALQSGTTRSVGAWPANRKAIVWYGTPGATGSRPMASKKRAVDPEVADRVDRPTLEVLIPDHRGTVRRPELVNGTACSANGRTRPPKKTPTMLFASRLPRWGVAMKMTRRTYGSGWKNRSWSTAGVAGEHVRPRVARSGRCPRPAGRNPTRPCGRGCRPCYARR